MLRLHSIVFSGRPNTYSAWRAVFVLSGGIPMKRRDIAERFSRSEIKSQAHRAMVMKILWTRLLMNRRRDLNQYLHKYLLHLGDELVKYLRWCGQRSRSRSDDHENLVNWIAREPLKEFEPKPTKNTHYIWETNWLRFQGQRSKVKVITRRIILSWQRQKFRWCGIECHSRKSCA